jgi:hypothetical protein
MTQPVANLASSLRTFATMTHVTVPVGVILSFSTRRDRRRTTTRIVPNLASLTNVTVRQELRRASANETTIFGQHSRPEKRVFLARVAIFPVTLFLTSQHYKYVKTIYTIFTNTGLFEMIVGVLTTSHTQYT